MDHRLQQCGAVRVRRGFSLIEVLIAVVILAIGLLGVGAVFPVVLQSQKQAADSTFGSLAARSVEVWLSARVDSERRLTSVAGVNTVWRDWRDSENEFDVDLGDPDEVSRWVVPEYEANTGLMTIGDGLANEIEISLADRLYPNSAWIDTASEGAKPTFVWDFVVRRVVDTDGLAANDQLELAVFVRRLDGRLRPPAGESVLESLTADDPPSRLAVAVDGDGRPTGNGIGDYARPGVLEDVEYDPAEGRDRLRLPQQDGSDTEAGTAWAAQIGQKFVDNLGNVYTVTRVEEVDSDVFVRVNPAVPVGVQPTSGNGRHRITSIAVTPQVASWVWTFRVDP